MLSGHCWFVLFNSFKKLFRISRRVVSGEGERERERERERESEREVYSVWREREGGGREFKTNIGSSSLDQREVS